MVKIVPDAAYLACSVRWGLVLFWAKEIKVGFSNINAKAEGIEGKPAFREAFQPRGGRGVLNDTLSIYFLDMLASAFAARWCAGYKVETAEGVFRVREDEPLPRVGTGLHRTP